MKIPLIFLSSAFLTAMTVSRPAQVVKVFPAEGSTLTNVEVISAQLDFTEGEKVDPASLRMIVDGVVVTAQSVIRMSRDWPPSSVWISYKPFGLEARVYRVEIQFRTETSGTATYAWSFTVASRSK